MQKQDELQRRLHEAEDTLQALRRQEIDAVVGSQDVLIVRLQQAERKLRETEQRVRLATEAAEIGTWEWNLVTDEATWDLRESQLLGMQQECANTQATEFFDRVHPSDLPELRRKLAHAIEQNKPYEHEFRVIRADGQTRWLAGRGEVVRDKAGKPLRMRGVNFDITDRKQTELELQRTKDELADFVENATIGLHWVGPDGSVLWANRTELEMLGYTEDEYVGRNIAEFHADQDMIADILSRLNRFEELHDYEARLLCKDGSIKDVLIDSNVFQEDGRFIHTRCFTRDVTSRKRAEQALQELNESLEQQVAERIEVLSVLQDVTRAANEALTVDDAIQAALARISHYNDWQVGHVWELANDGSGQLVDTNVWYVSKEATVAKGPFEEFQRNCQTMRFSSGQGLIGAVLATGESQWIDDVEQYTEWQRPHILTLGLRASVAFPITINGEVTAVLEFFSGHSAEREARFMEIMPDVGIQLGHVIERKRLESQVANAAELEQRRLGSDIHDGVGQELTGMRYLAQTHAESLVKQASPDAPVAERIAAGLETVQKKLRAVMQRLVPVEVDEEGLVAALRSLAQRTGQSQTIECTFECESLVAVEDNLKATHIYRIAQEAVSNAVRHANAQRITIRLDEEDNQMRLQVIDDGQGIGPQPKRHDSFGLHSMAFRAGLIGGWLNVQSRQEGGTAVICTIPKAKS